MEDSEAGQKKLTIDLQINGPFLKVSCVGILPCFLGARQALAVTMPPGLCSPPWWGVPGTRGSGSSDAGPPSRYPIGVRQVLERGGGLRPQSQPRARRQGP